VNINSMTPSLFKSDVNKAYKGHKAMECKSVRKDVFRTDLPEMTADAAWEAMKAADNFRDIDDFKEVHLPKSSYLTHAKFCYERPSCAMPRSYSMRASQLTLPMWRRDSVPRIATSTSLPRYVVHSTYAFGFLLMLE
jgi:hypothetical protein